MPTASELFEGWAILEVMGHRQVAGYLREVHRFGAQMAQIEIPEIPARTRRTFNYQLGRDVDEEVSAVPGFTQFYGGSAIFSMTPTTEEVARAAAQRFRVEPPRKLEVAPSARQLEAAPPDAETVDDGPGDDLDRDDDGGLYT